MLPRENHVKSENEMTDEAPGFWIGSTCEELPFRSGEVKITDPAFGGGVVASVTPGAIAKFSFVMGPSRLLQFKDKLPPGLLLAPEPVAVKIDFDPANKATERKLLGKVGVDSAMILVCDSADVEDLPDEALFISEEDPRRPITRALERKYRLTLRPLYDGLTEVLDAGRATLHASMSEFVRRELKKDPESVLLYNDQYDLFERATDAELNDSELVPLGNSNGFLVCTGGDGSFSVFADCVDDGVARLWIMLRGTLIGSDAIPFPL